MVASIHPSGVCETEDRVIVAESTYLLVKSAYDVDCGAVVAD